MMRIKGLALAIVACTGILPQATSAQTTFRYFTAHAQENSAPNVLDPAEREYYTALFSAIDNQDWARVQDLFAQRLEGPLHPVAQAEYYLAATSPRVELPALKAWMQAGRDLPQAGRISRLAQKRGALSTDLPALPTEQRFIAQPSEPRRARPAAVNDGTMPADIASAILERIKGDDPDGARMLLDSVDAQLSPDARTEWRHRLAWSYYIENNDRAALAMGMQAAQGSGAWVAEGEWVSGLAAWRLGDCDQAANHFELAARRAHNAELTAAGYYWAARSNTRCRKPERVNEMLRGAAANDRTLYGMLAAEQLGRKLPQSLSGADFSQEDWNRLRQIGNVRVAIALAEIGRNDLADEVLRHQARIGDPRQFDALSRLARDFGLASTQLWMAHNAPAGAQAEPASRYPTPKWQPATGWRIDPALIYAHALQESNFRTQVVSPAGARGLMQIMPATARHHAPSLNMTGSFAELAEPSVNLAYGQRTLETLRDSPVTGGYLPKVMAAYNAGLTPVGRWNTEVRDQGDPLTWMESIPYWETRGYVSIVTRNYWMYERQAGASSSTRQSLAENAWPRFPDGGSGGSVGSGTVAVR